MQFVNEGHLGGFVAADEHYPNGDPMTYCPGVWKYLLYKFLPKSVCDVGCGEGHAVKWFRDRKLEVESNHPDVEVLADMYHRRGRSLQSVFGVEGCKTGIDKGIVPAKLIVHHDFTQGCLAVGASNADLTKRKPSHHWLG